MDWSPPRKPALLPAVFVDPCIPTLVDKPPTGPAWVHEIKYDGYRMMVWRDDDRVRLFTRRGFDWTDRYPLVVRAALRLPATRFMIDGEMVVCRPDGVSEFDHLHSRQHDDDAVLYAFDLLSVEGADVRGERLDDRRAKLKQLLRRPERLLFSDHHSGDGAVMFEHACRIGLEGIVSKRRDSTYRSGKSKAWLKTRNPDGPSARRHSREDET